MAVAWLAILLAFAAATCLAHHSLGAFDVEREVILSGEVLEFEWKNPHTLTHVRVTKEDGSTTDWTLEGMSPDYLGRRGWTRSTLTPGERIEVTLHPLKNRQAGGTFLRATLEDGTVVVMFTR